MMKRWLIGGVLFIFSSVAFSQGLTIEVKKGVRNPTPIAVVPFAWTGTGFNGDLIAEIVSDDMYRSGQFSPIDKKNMLSLPHAESEVIYRDWRMSGAEYLVTGQLVPRGDGGFTANFILCDINGQKTMFSKTIQGGPNNIRDIAHYISDAVYEALTGFRGAFQTKIIYVGGEVNNVKLYMADQDGARDQVLLTSKEPILSPDWSPDGKKVAYVSFDGRKPGIYIQTIATGQRERLTDFPGLNGAPQFSPDGGSLAMCLSKDGNPEIYVMNLSSRQLRRITNHFGIDTEPSWTADGSGIIFTSNRGGKPQLYKVSLASGQTERITFEGDYNAHGHMSEDGKMISFIHRRDGVFHTAVQDVKSGRVTILTQTNLDESPALAPNGRMIMYATKKGRQGVLATVSVDGGVQVPLPAKNGDVREPAWGPFTTR
ncbi:MAG TPA: Tol-Pal system beta propeller repeat protein TolB [Pseudomonadales bacterium]|nr:Tol-Pal system beta propeller repeat protein TolB [Pseudomonadales bacterium]